MNVHKNARLSQHSRAEVVRRVEASPETRRSHFTRGSNVSDRFPDPNQGETTPVVRRASGPAASRICSEVQPPTLGNAKHREVDQTRHYRLRLGRLFEVAGGRLCHFQRQG